MESILIRSPPGPSATRRGSFQLMLAMTKVSPRISGKVYLYLSCCHAFAFSEGPDMLQQTPALVAHKQFIYLGRENTFCIHTHAYTTLAATRASKRDTTQNTCFGALFVRNLCIFCWTYLLSNSVRAAGCFGFDPYPFMAFQLDTEY